MKSHARGFFLSYPESDDGAPHHHMAFRILRKRGFDIEMLDPSGETVVEKILRSFHAVKTVYSTRMRGELRFLYVESAPQTPLAYLMRFLDCPIIYQTQDYLEPRQSWKFAFYRLFERSLAKRANLVISNEINRARFMASDYGLSKSPMVIRTALPRDWPVPEPTPEEITEQRKELGLPQDKKLVAAGGGFREDRMSPQVVHALRNVPDDVCVVFTGRPPLEKLGDFSRTLLESGRILFVDRRPFGDLLVLYSVCDAGLLLYPDYCIGHFYQAPGRLTEFTRAGLPIICSRFPGFELLCCKYSIGSTCDPYSPLSIAKATVKCLDPRRFSRNKVRAIANKQLAYDVDSKRLIGELKRII